jgi:hypothetical protein
MLQFLNRRTQKIILFKNYDKLYKHINHCEKEKQASNAPEALKGWRFTSYSYQRTLAFYTYIASKKKIERQGFDVLEISQGNLQKPLLIPITPDIDVISLKEEWCLKYCETHGYLLMTDSGASG